MSRFASGGEGLRAALNPSYLPQWQKPSNAAAYRLHITDVGLRQRRWASPDKLQTFAGTGRWNLKTQDIPNISTIISTCSDGRSIACIIAIRDRDLQ